MGKIFFYVALALVMVSGLMFAPEARRSLAIHPMDQFIVSSLFAGDSVSMFCNHQRDHLVGAGRCCPSLLCWFWAPRAAPSCRAAPSLLPN